jgi:4-amino-4-deoxy-L-arabinose transferase-like glycosyltransferase
LSSPTAPKPQPRARVGSVLILLAITLVIYVGSAGRPALLDDADGCHALAAREILQRQDWTVLHINGIRWLEKPPLHYWLVALSYLVLGESAFATRLPIALAMVGLVLLLYEFGRRFFSERAGFYAGLVMSTSAGPFLFTRIMIPEALYALEFTAAFYLFLRAWTGSLSPRVGYWGTAGIIGLATLTRAGIGALFPLGIVAMFVVAAGAWSRSSEARRRLAAIPIWSAGAIALLVALPWHVAASLRTPGFLWFYFVNEQVLRAIGKRYPADYTAVPLGIWWAAHAVWFFPWIVFVGYAWRERPPFNVWKNTSNVSSQALLLTFIWAAAIFLFFSLVSGSRMEYYSFGAWPAVALLIGVGLDRAEARSDGWLPRLLGIVAVVGVLSAAVLFGLVWMSRGISNVADITQLMTRHDTDFYRVSMATLFDLTPQAFAALRLPAAIAASALTIGPAIVWWLGYRGRFSESMVGLGVTMVAFFYAANLAFQTFEPRLSSRPLAANAMKILTPDDHLIVYGEFAQACSFSFYLDRPAWIYNGRYNGLEFGSHFADAPQIFLDDEQFDALWTSNERTFLFVPPEQRGDALAQLSRTHKFFVSESGSKTLYANQPLGRTQTGARLEPH